jgi:PAS domain S-box-containing protein
MRAALDAEHFRAIADYTYDWETWVGPSGEVRWVNPAVERITGYTAAECMALPDYPMELVHEPDRAGVRSVLERALAGESGNHFEFRVLRKDGVVVWAAISWQPLVSARGEHLGYRSSVRDINERKQLESQLHTALWQAESASRAKSEFLANVSHELRTPLQSILGYAQLLGAAALPPTLRGYVTTLLEQSEQLDHLVSDLLDYSSLQAGVLPLRSEVYEPRALVERVLRALTPAAERKGLSLALVRCDVPPAALGDPVRIAQVLGNLIMNAIKFTARGGAEVSVERVADDPGSYRVIVDDTGPGMPDDESLFAPFRQAQSHAARSAGGVGLGLAISRQLCERMGGTLASAQGPSGGARFVATFPLHVEGHAPSAVERFQADEAPAQLNRSFAQRHPLTVLVIDDMQPAREFMHAALYTLGYDAELAASAEEGYRLVEAQAFGLVLVDIQMPNIDGWAAARGLRARLGPLPFLVALTANALANDSALLEQAGFDGFAQKPLRIRELLALLRRAHERVAGARVSEFDAERWRELASIVTADGTSLLVRMRRRVESALPEVRARSIAARASGQASELGRALHELHGLFSLLGATRAAECAGRAERLLEQEGLAAVPFEELETRLDAVVAELARPLPGPALANAPAATSEGAAAGVSPVGAVSKSHA